MIDWQPNPACSYKNPYHRIFRDIGISKAGKWKEVYGDTREEINELYALRWLILNDLFFVVQFVLEIPPTNPKTGGYFCNHPFVVDRCRDVESGQDGWTLDLWARGFFKSSIITIGRTIQRILRNPESCTMIASHTRPAAKKFFRSVKLLLESSPMLKQCFPDILWDNPEREAPKWSEDDGVVVKRKSIARKESTLEAWGIKEGMPIGVHFDKIILDDLETEDDVLNPDVVGRVRKALDLTNDLLSVGGSIDVVGTPYSHVGVYIPYVRDLKKADGSPAYVFRRYPATDDGTVDGNHVFLSKEDWEDLKARKSQYTVSCQQLINPTPVGSRRFESKWLTEVPEKNIPKDLYKFMMIDPAGDAQNDSGDSWALVVLGVEPFMDSIGASRVFILDALIAPMRAEEAPVEIARMYRRNGLIIQVGIEKVSASLIDNYVTNILEKEHGIFLSEDRRNFVKLRPQGRKKEHRIETALAYPLFNGKIFLSTGIPQVTRDEIRKEFDNFPFYHPDFLDAFAYLYDILPNFHFGLFDEEDEDDRKVVNMVGRSNVTGY